MAGSLFLASTPLHSFFSLGLMRGPLLGQPHTLALIDQRGEQRDHIADALQACAAPNLSVVRFAGLASRESARRQLRQISDFTAQLAPSTIAIGNDRRTEFYAAVRGCPSARRTYVDDGLFSYLPCEGARAAWRERLSGWRRRMKFGLEVERPALIGGSRAVQDAYVLLPHRVHAGLRGKPVHALRPAWFADSWVRTICASAVASTGFDAAQCQAMNLLLLLPHPRFLQTHPELRRSLEALAAAHAARGEVVALKSHPAAAATPLTEQLRVPPGAVVEVPARLPVEVLVPLLSGTLVVGTLTTALLSMALLGDKLSVRSVLPRSAGEAERRYSEAAFDIYDSVGIHKLDEAA